jgi:hypothetical protein
MLLFYFFIDYPLAPEHMVIDNEMLSPFQKTNLEMGVKKDRTTKLVPNLKNKEKYVIHSKNLQLYLELGMTLKKIHRGIKFTQTR